MNTLYQGKKYIFLDVLITKYIFFFQKPWRFPFVYTVGWFVISGRQEDRLNAAK